jgi:hypothetical protein
VVLFVSTLWYVLFLHCGTFCFYIVLLFVFTLWYFLFLHYGTFCFYIVVLFVSTLWYFLFLHCGTFCFYIVVLFVSTLWYFLFFILLFLLSKLLFCNSLLFLSICNKCADSFPIPFSLITFLVITFRNCPLFAFSRVYNPLVLTLDAVGRSVVLSHLPDHSYMCIYVCSCLLHDLSADINNIHAFMFLCCRV